MGVGTEFLVFLPSSSAPVTKEIRNPATPAAPAPPAPTRTPEQARVLVVEDQAAVSKAACGMLSHLGYEATVAINGDEALRIFRRYQDTTEPFDVILLDMTLPGGLTGRDVFDELANLDPSVKVIATSGYFEDGPTDALSEIGFTGVLAKPYSMDALALTIGESLNT